MIPTTLLHRQVSAAYLQHEEITSQVFKPTGKDNKRLSVYDGSQISAADAWKHYVQALSYRSIGVVAVTVQESTDLQLGVKDDPAPFAGHAVIDFTGFSRSQIERKADSLKQLAVQRGWQFGPVETP